MGRTRTSIEWHRDEEGIVTLTLDDPEQRANTMNALFRKSLRSVVRRLVREKEVVRGVIVTSAKKTFFAGGDLNLLLEAQPSDAQRLHDEVIEMNAQLRALETLGVPVVAALNGSALGGGLEIALACHHRVALDIPTIELGFPEVTLGLMPGANGVVRSVRLLGIADALSQVLLQGQRMTPSAARAIGLIDALAPDREALLAAARRFILENPAAAQPWDSAGHRIPGGTPADPAFAAQLPALPAMLRKQLRGCDLPAPRAIMAAAVEGAQTTFDNAAKIESRYFVELATARIAKNMIHTLFFDTQRIAAGESRPGDVAAWRPEKVAVLGAGMMGSGIAYVTARAGFPCILKDVSSARAEQGKAYSAQLLDVAVSRGRLEPQAAERILQRIHATGAAEDLQGCDLVIEAVFEDRQLKSQVMREAEAHAAPGALLCSNTSTLPITGLAAAARDETSFVGLHFFSPVDRMPLVEIIVGERTSDAALAHAFDFVRQIGKTPIVVNDSRGFFTSRVFSTFVMEGVTMLSEGFHPASIEQAALQNGSPVGPLAVCDEVSLTLTRSVREQAREDLAAEGTPHPETPADRLIDRMCLELGRAGKAAGAGFYEYPQAGKKHLWPGLVTHFVDASKARPSDEAFRELRDRLLYRTAIESARCLEEGVVRSVGDANVGSILGIGAPPWTGGTLQFIDHVGIRPFLARALELSERHGERFAPPALLLEMAERDEGFRKAPPQAKGGAA